MPTFQYDSGDPALMSPAHVMQEGDAIKITIDASNFIMTIENGRLEIRMIDVGCTGNISLFVKPVASNSIKLVPGR